MFSIPVERVRRDEQCIPVHAEQRLVGETTIRVALVTAGAAVEARVEHEDVVDRQRVRRRAHGDEDCRAGSTSGRTVGDLGHVPLTRDGVVMRLRVGDRAEARGEDRRGPELLHRLRVGHVTEVRVRDPEDVVHGLEHEAVALGQSLIRRRVGVAAVRVLVERIQTLGRRVVRRRDRKAMGMRDERGVRRHVCARSRARAEAGHLAVRPPLARDAPVMRQDRRRVRRHLTVDEPGLLRCRGHEPARPDHLRRDIAALDAVLASVARALLEARAFRGVGGLRRGRCAHRRSCKRSHQQRDREGRRCCKFAWLHRFLSSRFQLLLSSSNSTATNIPAFEAITPLSNV